MGHLFVIGLGTNLGAREQNLARAVEHVAQLDGQVEAVSRVYESAPVGPPQPDYLNAALRLSTSTSPMDLLAQLLGIETALGRVRTVRWGPRHLDLDILWGSERCATPALTIPHTELPTRTFALAPLLDVAPELARTYAETLRALGGPPSLRGALHFAAERRVCEFERLVGL